MAGQLSWLERRANNADVVGSIPILAKGFFCTKWHDDLITLKICNNCDPEDCPTHHRYKAQSNWNKFLANKILICMFTMVIIVQLSRLDQFLVRELRCIYIAHQFLFALIMGHFFKIYDSSRAKQEITFLSVVFEELTFSAFHVLIIRCFVSKSRKSG